MMEIVTSAQNPIIKQVRALSERKGRKKFGLFVVEGQQPVWRAVSAGWKIQTLLHAPDLAQGDATRQMVRKLETESVKVIEISAELFSRLSSREGPTGIMAVVEIPKATKLSDLEVAADDLYVVLHKISNPGNLGTIMRTADAVGAKAVVGLDQCADPYAPQAVKASMGGLFAVEWVHCSSVAFMEWAQNRLTIYATSGYAAQNFWQQQYEMPAALLLGNEGAGLPDYWLEKAHHKVAIPMTGTAESLNLSVAAGVLMYEMRRASSLFDVKKL